MPPEIPPASPSELSAFQLRIWYYQKLNPESPLFNIAGFAAINGEAEPLRWKNAVQLLLQEQQALRIRLSEVNHVPVQSVGSPGDTSILIMDFTDRENPEEAAARWMEQETGIPFGMSGPLFLTALIRLRADFYYWYVKAHHLVTDGWSFSLIFRRTSDLYLNGSPGGAGYSFLTFIRAEAEYSASEAGREAADYWRKSLSTLSPGDLQQKNGLRPSAAFRKLLPLTEDLYAAAKRWSEARQGSFLHYFATAFAWYMHAYEKQESVSIGLPVLNRVTRTEKETIGLFINLLPLILKDCGEKSPETLFAEVRKQSREMLRRQRFPLSAIERGCAPGTQLFDFFISYEKHAYGLKFGPYDAEVRYLHNGHEEHRAGIHIMEYADGRPPVIAFDFNRSSYSEEEGERLVRRLQHLLVALPGQGALPVGDTQPFAADELQSIVTSFARGPASKAIRHSAGAAWYARLPLYRQMPAIISGAEILSYEEVETRSNRLARAIRDSATSGPAGVLVAAGPMLPVTLLALAKTGRPWVPLLHSFPESRLSDIIQQAGIALVVADESGRERLSALPVRCVDPGISTDPHIDGDSRFSGNADDTLYITFTSGSTGRPKGVMVSHFNVVSFTQNLPDSFGFVPGQRILAVTSVTFDISVLELFCSLLSGLTIVFPGAEAAHDPALLLPKIKAGEIDILQLTPSRLRILGDYGGYDFLRSVRSVLTGGEELKKDIFEKIRPYLEEVSFFNVYGPSETTIWSTARRLKQDEENNIGRPLPGESVYILDSQNRLLPAGIPGELCIGGEGVSKGYLNRNDLTDERFIGFPAQLAAMGAEPDGKLYRTGDVACWTGQGEIRFLGRNDRQVKKRGYRIELEEIEYVFSRLAGIQGVLAVPKKSERGDTEIIAYYVTETTVTTQELREQLAQALPDYCLPDYYVPLDSFPLNNSGKIDMQALPAPQWPQENRLREAERPDTATESRIRPWFAGALDTRHIGLGDNFFEHGGYSLKASRFLADLFQHEQISLSLRDFFGHPTIESLAAFIDRKEELTPPATGTPLQPGKVYPASAAQQRMAALQALSAPGAYVMNGSWEWKGPMQESALREALAFLLQRHESLRTSFVLEENGLFQKIHEHADTPLLFSRDAAVIRERHGPGADFQPGKAPLFRVTVAGEGLHHVLYFSVHHLIADGWSVTILVRELLQAYADFSSGSPPAFPPLQLHYRDYAAWDIGRKNRPDEKNRNYWHTKLAGAERAAFFTANKRAPEGESAVVRIDLGIFRNKLSGFSSREKISLFSCCSALTGLLLWKTTGNSDVVLGTPVAGRDHPGFQHTAGIFVNTLVLRQKMSAEMNFLALAKAFQNEIQQAQFHGEYPYDRLLEEMRAGQGITDNGLFDYILHLEEDRMQEWNVIPGVEIRQRPNDDAMAQFLLDFGYAIAGEDFELTIRYSKSHFHPSRIERMAAEIQWLAGQAVENPLEQIGRLSLLPPAELEEVLFGKNRSLPASFVPGTVTALFEETARTHPDKTAIVAGEEAISFGELDRRSDAIARYLSEKLGDRPAPFVAVVSDRSPFLVTALLGIVKAGCAYLPIDPALPSERIRFMIGDSEAALVLAADACTAQLQNTGAAVVTEKEIRQLPAGADFTAPVIRPENPVYMIYTSGTTGTPKGTVISHAALCNLIAWHRAFYESDGESRMTLFAGTGFDASAWEIWPALVCGAALYPVPEATRQSLNGLVAFLNERRITHTFLPTALVHALLDDALPLPAELKILTGGEKFNRPVPANIRLYNNYGPTENTVVSTAADLRLFAGRDAEIPIGRPVTGTGILLVNGQLEPVAAGEPGEIGLFGAGLATGYWKQEEMNRLKFVELPYHATFTAHFPWLKNRMYLTGDLARWDEDGQLYYLGRKDQQLKIRGYRVEAEEIESVTRKIAGVKEACVRLWSDGTQEFLVCWIVAGDPAPGSDTLQQAWSVLPEYMRPQHHLVLDALPVTPNGKIDYKALPAPVLTAPAVHGMKLPENPVQEKLIQLVAVLLQGKNPGIDENLFHMGLNSIKAMQLAASVSREWKIDFPLSRIYEGPTIEKLALALMQSPSAAWKAVRKSTESPLRVSHAQKRIWTVNSLHPQSEAAYRLLAGFEVKGNLTAAQVRQSLHILSKRHRILRTVFRNEKGQLIQLVLDDPHFDFIDPDPANAIRLDDWKALPFDLAQGPLLRCYFLREDLTGKCRLHFALHHILADEWSMQLFMQEFTETASALARGEILSEAEASWQYGDFSAWQNELLEQEDSVRPLERFWDAELQQWPAPFRPPGIASATGAATFAGDTFRSDIPAELSASILPFCNRLGISGFSFFVAATQVLCCRIQQVNAGAVGITVSDRGIPEFEQVQGLFINMCPVKSRLEETLSLADYLQQTHRHLLQILEHRSYPYDLMLQKFRKHAPGNGGFFDIAVMLIRNSAELHGDDFSLQLEPGHAPGSKYPLSFLYPDSGETPFFAIEYNSAIYSAEIIRAWAAELLLLMETMTSATETPMGDLIAPKSWTPAGSADDFNPLELDF